jgi:hypothetical protein
MSSTRELELLFSTCKERIDKIFANPAKYGYQEEFLDKSRGVVESEEVVDGEPHIKQEWDNFTAAHKGLLFDRFARLYAQNIDTIRAMKEGGKTNDDVINFIAAKIVPLGETPETWGDNMYRDKLCARDGFILEMPGDASLIEVSEPSHRAEMLSTLGLDERASSITLRREDLIDFKASPRHSTYAIRLGVSKSGEPLVVKDLIADTFQAVHRQTPFKSQVDLMRQSFEKALIDERAVRKPDLEKIERLQRNIKDLEAFLVVEALGKKIKETSQKLKLLQDKVTELQSRDESPEKVLASQIKLSQLKRSLEIDQRREKEAKAKMDLVSFNAGSQVFLPVIPLNHKKDKLSKKVSEDLKDMSMHVFADHMSFNQATKGFDGYTAGVSGNAMHYALLASKFSREVLGEEITEEEKSKLYDVVHAHLVGADQAPLHHSTPETKMGFELGIGFDRIIKERGFGLATEEDLIAIAAESARAAKVESERVIEEIREKDVVRLGVGDSSVSTPGSRSDTPSSVGSDPHEFDKTPESGGSTISNASSVSAVSDGPYTEDGRLSTQPSPISISVKGVSSKEEEYLVKEIGAQLLADGVSEAGDKSVDRETVVVPLAVRPSLKRGTGNSGRGSQGGLV